MLDQEEWRPIEYLLWITQPFFKFTTALSQTKDVTIHTLCLASTTSFSTILKHLSRSFNGRKCRGRSLCLPRFTRFTQRRLSFLHITARLIISTAISLQLAVSLRHRTSFNSSQIMTGALSFARSIVKAFKHMQSRTRSVYQYREAHHSHPQ